jgi:hypothetical protein
VNQVKLLPYLAFVLMLFQERLEKLILASEGCLAKPVEGLGQVDLAPASRGIENAKRSHYRNSLGFSSGDTSAVIHKDCVDLEGSGQDNRCSFSAIEPQQNRVLGYSRRRNQGNPRRRVRDPGTNFGRCFCMGEFFLHLGGHVYRFKECRDKIDMPDQYEVVKRSGIGDNQAHAPKARGGSSRAVPAPDLRRYSLQTRREP